MKTWIGGPSTTAVPVTAWTEGGGASAQLGIATDDALSDVSWGSSVSADAYDLVRMEATGLDADARYYWAVWEDGQPEPATAVADFRTLPVPGTPSSYRFWAATCAGTGVDSGLVTGTVVNDERISNSLFFDDIAASGSDWGWHGGDMVYYNPGGTITPTVDTDVAGYVTQWTDVLQQTRQEALYQRIPLRYTWDDHDYGINNSDKTQVGRENAQEAWRRVVPHHDLPDDEGIFQTWQHGRVFFIASDTRSFRDPDTDPQGPNKTMLGGAQKAWMRGVLETAESNGAEFFVWLCPDSSWWVDPVESGSSNDSWKNYPHERDEILGWLTDLGWLDRMFYISGDNHAMGLDTGANNLYGGFPYMQAAPIDANPSSSANAPYDRGWRGSERGHWARVDVTDDGETIRLDIAGMVGATAVLSHTILHDTTEPEPPPPPPPPAPGPEPIAVARIRQEVTWLGVHRVTGRIIAELPDITGAGARQLSDYVTAEASIPLTNGGPGDIPIELIEAATDGKTGALVAVVNDLPLWMGLTSTRRGGTAPNMRVNTATPESYLLKRKVRDHSLTDVDRAVAAQTIIGDAQDWDDVGQGLGFELDTQLTGEVMSREYKATDRTSVYDALQALAAEGLEWECYFDWADNTQTSIVKIIRIRRHIGRITGTPDAMFETGAGSVVKYEFLEGWTEGDWANHTTAIAPGQGDDQPSSDPAIAQDQLDSGVPIVERVFQPGNNITETEDLQTHADADLVRAQDGTTALKATAMLNAYPRLGVDVLLGDQVSHRLVSPRHPDHRPLVGTRRVTGWSLDTAAGQWSPVLVDDPTVGAT